MNRFAALIRYSTSGSESDEDDDNITEGVSGRDTRLPYKDQARTMDYKGYIIDEDRTDEEDKGTIPAGQGNEVRDEIGPSELERRDKRNSENFSELMKTESQSGKLNKEVVYLNIATMKCGDIFVSIQKSVLASCS